MREVNTYILDTNFLHSLFVKEDALHGKAKEILIKLEKLGEFLIPFIVAAELLIAEKDGMDFIKACRKLSKKFVKNTENDLIFIQSLPANDRKTLKANDCLIWAITKRFNAKLITFDKKLEKIFNDY